MINPIVADISKDSRHNESGSSFKEKEFATSGFNFNDSSRTNVIYDRICMRARDIMCTHPRSSLFGTTPGPRPIHDRPRSSRRFRTIGVCVSVCVSRPFAFLYFSFGSGSFPHIICLFRSPHTSNPFEPFPACVSLFFNAESYRRGCRCNPVALPYVSLWRSIRRKALLSAASCTCARAYLRFHDTFARKARCTCASQRVRERKLGKRCPRCLLYLLCQDHTSREIAK